MKRILTTLLSQQPEVACPLCDKPLDGKQICPPGGAVLVIRLEPREKQMLEALAEMTEDGKSPEELATVMLQFGIEYGVRQVSELYSSLESQLERDDVH